MNAKNRKRVGCLITQVRDFEMHIQLVKEFLKDPNPNKANARRRNDSLAKLYDAYCESHRELIQLQPDHPVLDSLAKVTKSGARALATTASERFACTESSNSSKDVCVKCSALPADSQLMTTAVVEFAEKRGNHLKARALLDSCSTVNLMTERFANLLKLSTLPCAINIGAVDKIILQKTVLGWVVAGGSVDMSGSVKTVCNVVKLDKLIERFWIIEDFDHEPVRSRDDVVCDEHFIKHTSRDASGRHVVRLPFRDSKFELRKSKQQALKRLYSLLCRLEANPSLKSEYSKAMEEYLALGVAEIQKLGDKVQWRHVHSEDNPADALSRGQLPMDFVNAVEFKSLKRLKKGLLPAHLSRGFVHLFSFFFVPALCQGGGSDAPVETADGP
ncbi:hypothetical protein KM043_000133 [Ampulex compressa]|nr:hypothetical protein KM043_000133 [Ampulex compressa]